MRFLQQSLFSRFCYLNCLQTYSCWDAVALPFGLTMDEVTAASDLRTRISVSYQLSSPLLDLSTGVFWDGLLAFYSWAETLTVSWIKSLMGQRCVCVHACERARERERIISVCCPHRCPITAAQSIKLEWKKTITGFTGAGTICYCEWIEQTFLMTSLSNFKF